MCRAHTGIIEKLNNLQQNEVYLSKAGKKELNFHIIITSYFFSFYIGYKKTGQSEFFKLFGSLLSNIIVTKSEKAPNLLTGGFVDGGLKICHNELANL